MRRVHIILSAASLALLASGAVWADSDVGGSAGQVRTQGPVDSASQRQHIRVLAASCAACHGTNGNSVGGTPVLAGLHPEHFSSQMQAFKSGQRASTVMHRHARGLTDSEIVQLAEYFYKQPRHASALPPAAKPGSGKP
ncbi:MAG: hypothetical protein RL194_266 [Pseudomonadota bacterium]